MKLLLATLILVTSLQVTAKEVEQIPSSFQKTFSHGLWTVSEPLVLKLGVTNATFYFDEINVNSTCHAKSIQVYNSSLFSSRRTVKLTCSTVPAFTLSLCNTRWKGENIKARDVIWEVYISEGDMKGEVEVSERIHPYKVCNFSHGSLYDIDTLKAMARNLERVCKENPIEAAEAGIKCD